ncbi:MAG: DNA primase [Betaproteobacteria bacterium]|nr:DNA primase [Betaproteobacteria bacterium]
MIPQTFIDELLNRIDIVDVIEKFVPLRRSGANLSACCPFHEEKTPSFTVSQQKQFYHCFGCGVHGSAITFLMEHQGLGFIDSVESLANQAGMQVPKNQRSDSTELKRDSTAYFSATSRAASYYKRKLKGASVAIQYLKGRAIDGNIAAKFLVGYASNNWQELSNEFNDYESSSVLLEAGLVNEKDGRRYDRFRDRVIFPIRDFRGRVIAFGGRVIETGEPKYLNSPETPFFQKGKEVYGFWESRSSIRQERRIVVVEGYMDVVALHQHGITYAVATLGTAVTEFQIARLLKQCPDLIFCFDGDSAGRKAAFRALESAISQVEDGNKVSFLFLPDGEDPDSFVRSQGRNTFERKISEATPMSDVLLDELSRKSGDLASVEGKSRFASLFKPIVARIKAPMIRKLLIERVTSLTGLSTVDFGDITVAKTHNNIDFSVKKKPDSFKRARVHSEPSVLQHLIEMILAYPELVRDGDLSRLQGLWPNVKKHFPPSQSELLTELLQLANAQFNTEQIIGQLKETAFEDVIGRSVDLSRVRYQNGKVKIENVENEYAQAWEQLDRLARLNMQKELLANKTLSELSEDERNLYRSLERSQSDSKTD